MAQIGSIDLNKLRGLSDKFVGLQKEIFGTLLGNEKLQDEGRAQQERASEELKSLSLETKAAAKDAKAEVLEQKQKAAQRAKENA